MSSARETYRQMVLWDFAWEARTGLNLAFYRTFAVPHIAGLLGHTGQIDRQPLKRSMDTGLLMYELIDSGPDSTRGRIVIEMLNRMHRKWSIANDDYRYVLATFIVVPTRWIDEFGWRRTTPEERTATTEFYIEVGGHMGIRDLPRSYDEAARYLDAYESEHLGYSAAGAALTATLGVALAELFPRPLRGASDLLTRLMLNDEMCRALGLDPPSRLARCGFKTVMGLRAKIVPFWPTRKQPAFRAGRSGSHVYPDGYNLDDLGVNDDGKPPRPPSPLRESSRPVS